MKFYCTNQQHSAIQYYSLLMAECAPNSPPALCAMNWRTIPLPVIYSAQIT